MKKKILFMVACLPFLAMMACATASTKVTSKWKDPHYQAVQMKKVLVIGIARRQGIRNMFESEFAQQLRNHGVEAFESYTIFNSTGMADQATINAAVKQYAIDTILITRLLDRKDVQTYVPQTAPFEDFYGFYSTTYDYMNAPAYTVQTDKVFVLETSLYNAVTNKLFWTTDSDTTFQGEADSAIQSYIKTITNQMQQDNMLPGKPK